MFVARITWWSQGNATWQAGTNLEFHSSAVRSNWERAIYIVGGSAIESRWRRRLPACDGVSYDGLGVPFYADERPALTLVHNRCESARGPS